ncbi:hypothetical protein C4J83_4991 [Pseudomonas sp. LBUM920]|nr:hypothetical protein C4J83_4991 [Pseudomonas sp. LBUM920]
MLRCERAQNLQSLGWRGYTRVGSKRDKATGHQSVAGETPSARVVCCRYRQPA